MIKPADLLEDYERVAGPVAFTLSMIHPDMEGKVAVMMQEVIDGRRDALTDEELGIHTPGDAEA